MKLDEWRARLCELAPAVKEAPKLFIGVDTSNGRDIDAVLVAARAHDRFDVLYASCGETKHLADDYICDEDV